MEYRLKIDDQIIPVACDAVKENTVEVSLDGKEMHVSYSRVSDNQLHLVIDGIGVTAYVTGNGGEKTVVIAGVPYVVRDADALEQVSRNRRGPREIPQDITPPMPSVVVRILVAAGDKVVAGSGVIVVTAMKMETTLAAPFDGTVTSINVAVGDKVMPGQVLVDIERDGEPAAEQQEAGG